MKIIIILVSIISIAIFLSVNIPPDESKWIFGFITFLIPLCLVVNIFLLIYLGIKRSYYFLFPLGAFLVGFKFISATINFNNATPFIENGFRIVNYNVSGFSEVSSDQKGENVLIDWVLLQDADIYCFQEFANDDASEHLNTIERLKVTYPYYNFSSVQERRNPDFGVAIFSKFPIVDQGEMPFEGKEYNRAAFADIVLENDTIRVISIHLESMQLNRVRSIDGGSLEKIKQFLAYTYHKIKVALIEGSAQTDKLLSFISSSPHPVIICGDFNHTPYSYVYNEFNKSLSNSFENKGHGFGITYAGETLFFLRIDHQFFDPCFFKNTGFQTFNDLEYSDHYPIEGTYHSIADH